MSVSSVVEDVEGGVEIAVRVQPRASRTEVVGLHGDHLKVRVAAPPVDGAANAELVKHLARRLAVPRAKVTVVRGETSRSKMIRVEGVGAVEVRARLGL